MPNYIGAKEEPDWWQNIRRERYAAHNGICYFCDKPVPEGKYVVHHKLQRMFAPESEQSLEGLLRRDGIHNKRNLAPAHPDCHNKHHRKFRQMWGAKA